VYSGSIKGKVLQRKAVGHAMQFLCKLPRFKKTKYNNTQSSIQRNRLQSYLDC